LKKEGMEEVEISTVQDHLAGRWYIQTKFVNRTIVVSIKTSSSREIWRDSVDLLIEGNRVVRGEIKHISGQDQDEAESADRHLEFQSLLPPTKRIGPELNVGERSACRKYGSSGESDIDLINPAEDDKLMDFVEANMDVYARSGRFLNYFSIPRITFLNKTSEPTSIVYLDVYYHDHDSTWKKCLHPKIGRSTMDKFGSYDYSWFNSTNLNFGPNEAQTVAVGCSISIEGTPGRDNQKRWRAHKSLPQPLRLKVRITDNKSKTRSIVFEQSNRKLPLPTKESISKEVRSEVFAFVYCDDTELDERSFVAVYKDEGSNKNSTVVAKTQETSFSWDWKAVKALEYQYDELLSSSPPASPPPPELALNHMSTENRKVWALLTPNTGKLYGLRFNLKTKTSQVDESVLFPKLSRAKQNS